MLYCLNLKYGGLYVLRLNKGGVRDLEFVKIWNCMEVKFMYRYGLYIQIGLCVLINDINNIIYLYLYIYVYYWVGSVLVD